ncbi:hypothetical protein V6N12_007263 [Hibiscus sabdariffa]|uniref:Uncharacterized protein n=1 Tax=Hibiscus sabdariffa TaxID=183260 RepID=A0ABR2F1B3_9ROSI
MVSNSSRTGKNVDDGGLFEEDEVVVLDKDYIVDHAGNYPTIHFSNRVHDQIDRCTRNVIIIHLLGGDNCPKTHPTPETMVDSNGPKSNSEISKEDNNKVENLYGPWMVAENRQKRTTVNAKTGNATRRLGNQGSRYEVLQVEDDNPTSPNANIIDVANVDNLTDFGMEVVNEIHLRANVFEHTGCVSGDPSAVVLLKKGHGKSGVLGTTNPKAQAVPAKGSKESNSRCLKIWNNLDNKGVNHPALQKWAQNVSAQLSTMVE